MNSEFFIPNSEFPSRVAAAFEKARSALLAEREELGHWEGTLSSSPLATATAVTALFAMDQALDGCQLPASASVSQSISSSQSLFEPPAPPLRYPRYQGLIGRGLEWIAKRANSDGGWGDTDRSRSNVSTTVLCWSALNLVGKEDDHPFQGTVDRAEAWLREYAGGLEAEKIAAAVTRRYGKDKTFSAPILTMAAIAGRLGDGRTAWRWVRPLPFELAAFPPKWYAALRLPVVSYALPALIAVGMARHTHLPPKSPILRAIRSSFRIQCLSVLQSIQPANGGFLEATPLTSFVAMSMASSRLAGHPVALKAADFIANSARKDGSWAIDTNLSAWVTTLSVNALGTRGLSGLPREEREALAEWIRRQQYPRRHPYTQAEPGGWTWTDLPGGVPDADDTAGALIALRRLWELADKEDSAFSTLAGLRQSCAAAGIRWLCNVQNRDGGVPTFCRGWGKLPFDRSSDDITAHAVRAWSLWMSKLAPKDQVRAERSLRRAVRFLLSRQRGDGSWRPLWFGNQEVSGDENPVYGTARVLLALIELPKKERREAMPSVAQGMHWLALNQNDDGGWGGSYGASSSVEETSLAMEALFAGASMDELKSSWTKAATGKGLEWLLRRVEADQFDASSPIGFYFAKLWYYEKLYPIVFVVGALRRAVEVFQPEFGLESKEFSSRLVPVPA